VGFSPLTNNQFFLVTWRPKNGKKESHKEKGDQEENSKEEKVKM